MTLYIFRGNNWWTKDIVFCNKVLKAEKGINDFRKICKEFDAFVGMNRSSICECISLNPHENDSENEEDIDDFETKSKFDSGPETWEPDSKLAHVDTLNKGTDDERYLESCLLVAWDNEWRRKWKRNYSKKDICSFRILLFDLFTRSFPKKNIWKRN